MQPTLDDGFTKPLRDLTDPQEMVRVNDIKVSINDHIKKIRWGRYTLFILAGLYVLSGLISPLLNDAVEDMYIYLEAGIMATILVVSGLTTYRYIAVGLIVGLAAFVAYELINIALNPGTVFQGLLRKIAVLYFLGQAIFAYYAMRKALNRLAAYPVPAEELRLPLQLVSIPRTRQLWKRTER